MYIRIVSIALKTSLMVAGITAHYIYSKAYWLWADICNGTLFKPHKLGTQLETINMANVYQEVISNKRLHIQTNQEDTWAVMVIHNRHWATSKHHLTVGNGVRMKLLVAMKCETVYLATVYVHQCRTVATVVTHCVSTGSIDWIKC